MTLPDVLTAGTTQGLIPASRVKDLHTSIRYLAQALGTSPEALPDVAVLESTYRQTLTNYFTSLEHPPGHSTVKNTLTNLSFLFRTARTLAQQMPEIPRRRTRGYELQRSLRETSPYRHRMNWHAMGSYYLPMDRWPAEIRETWQRYQTERQLEVRASTLKTYHNYLMAYVGYNLTVDPQPVTTWAQLFEIDRLLRFVAWHAKRLKVERISHTGATVARILITISKHQQRPEYQAMRALVQKLKTAEPMHNKQDAIHSIDPREIEQVGLTLLAEARKMGWHKNGAKHPGMHGSLKHQTGLIFRLMVRVPLRSRNIREMQLGKHLFQDANGTWQLRFQGEDLKIRQRKGRINTFARPFPTDLVEHLEEFLHVYRPRMPNHDVLPNVFITLHGKPFNTTTLGIRLTSEIWARLHKRFYPHLIRTIMTDTMLIQGVDISTVAFLLNDSPEMVYKRYHELRANDHIKKADQFMQSLLEA